MKIYINPSNNDLDTILARPQQQNTSVEPRVRDILQKVKTGGNTAIIDLTREIDKANLQSLQVTEAEIAEAEKEVPEALKQAINTAYNNIKKFHSAQLHPQIDIETAPGVRCVQRSVPISNVGLYIPGGTAPLFSTVLMLAIPAKIAGCKNIILCSPPAANGKINSVVLYTAKLCGVNAIFKAGGAMAVGAMAYGTETIPKVDKIFGPGNQYVMVAKQLVSVADVAIDMPAGPSEVMVLADETAVPAFVAADLLSQAEHGSDSQVILVCNSQNFAQETLRCVAEQLDKTGRKATGALALDNSAAIVVESYNRYLEICARYAPEHLIISTKNAWDIANKIESAGSIFIGNYTPESAGDYASGTNHTLPTSGWASSYSGVNIDSFAKKITYQEITREGLAALGPVIETMAMAEGLDAHAAAVTVRLKS